MKSFLRITLLAIIGLVFIHTPFAVLYGGIALPNYKDKSHVADIEVGFVFVFFCACAVGLGKQIKEEEEGK